MTPRENNNNASHTVCPPAPLPMPVQRAFYSGIQDGTLRQSVQPHLSYTTRDLSSRSRRAILLRILSTFFHPVAFAYEWGLVPCMEHCKSASKRREKSNETSCRALQEFAVRISATPARACGLRKQPNNSPHSSGVRFDRPLIKSQASKSPQLAPFKRSSIVGYRSADRSAA